MMTLSELALRGDAAFPKIGKGRRTFFKRNIEGEVIAACFLGKVALGLLGEYSGDLKTWDWEEHTFCISEQDFNRIVSENDDKGYEAALAMAAEIEIAEELIPLIIERLKT